MTASKKEAAREKKLPPTPWGMLPPRLTALFIGGSAEVGDWLADAFRSDSACDVSMERVAGIAAAMARLRDEPYDVVLISHEPETLDALELLDAIRAGSSHEQPILVLGERSERELADLCFESGADGYLCLGTTTTRALLWQLARARERHELIDENRRMRHAQRNRMQVEHDEASRLLQQQRSLIAGLEAIPASTGIDEPIESESDAAGTGLSRRVKGERSPCRLPATLVEHYRDLLRAYVIMGSGNLAGEMSRLAGMLAGATVSGQQLMLLHLQVLEEVISSLGSRSARHVMNRGDLLILEVMMNVADAYRQQVLRQRHPPIQQLLPGFDPVSLPRAG